MTVPCFLNERWIAAIALLFSLRRSVFDELSSRVVVLVSSALARFVLASEALRRSVLRFCSEPPPGRALSRRDIRFEIVGALDVEKCIFDSRSFFPW